MTLINQPSRCVRTVRTKRKNYLKGLERWSDLPHEQILSRREERRREGRKEEVDDEAALITLLASGSAAL